MSPAAGRVPGPDADCAVLADWLWTTARDQEQAAVRVPDDERAERVRGEVRRLAAEQGLRVRTARMTDTVVVVRLDAAVWHEDAATMRRKLSPTGPTDPVPPRP